MVEIIAYAKAHDTVLVGPGCAGVIAPGICKAGAHPVRFFMPGRVGVVSKSGHCPMRSGKTLTDAGIGQSCVTAIGGGTPVGIYSERCVALYEEDPDTDVIVLLGEIGGGSEENAGSLYQVPCDEARGVP